MLPLTLITGIFGMNTIPGLVFIKNFSDFYVIIGAMVLTGLCMFVYFRMKKWI
jgi:Mg2+ and Co2+ transporter CorA